MKILEHVHLNFPKKETFLGMYRQMFQKLKVLKHVVKFSKPNWKMYCQMFLKIKNLKKWSDNFIKNQEISKNVS